MSWLIDGIFGISSASTKSVQDAITNITQEYAGTCDMSCNNSMSGIDINLIDTTAGDINITQACAVNGTCLFENSMNATSDTLFKASNSTNAKNANGAFNIDISSTKSYQDIITGVNQSITQACNMTTSNQMSNVNVFASDSSLGNINIGQTGATNGNCVLSSAMNANVTAQGDVDNCTLSGKKAKKCGAGKGGASWEVYLLYGVGVIIFIFVLSMILRLIFHRKTPTTVTTSTATTHITAAAQPIAPPPPQVIDVANLRTLAEM